MESEVVEYLTLTDGRCPSESFVIFEVSALGGELVDVIDGTADGIDLEAMVAWGDRCSLADCPPPPAGWSFFVEACDA